jgi:predicted O-methyltransferase YrrM
VIISYIKHLLKAKTLHGTHSPFVYSFLKNVVYQKNHHPDFKKIELLRKELLKNNTKIIINDYGAGSRINKSKQRSISSIARTSVKSKKYSELLYRICLWHQPEYVLELGTSLGITSAYLSLAAKNIVTIEGCKNIASIARENFKKLNLKNIQLINDKFDNCLNIELEKIKNQRKIIFVDGNHKKEPTINYFNCILNNITEKDILIFDDIHWSKEMEEAWLFICNHPTTTVTIDLFQLGIVFFHKHQAKQNFKIRF